jgi:hypothetical protein
MKWKPWKYRIKIFNYVRQKWLDTHEIHASTHPSNTDHSTAFSVVDGQVVNSKTRFMLCIWISGFLALNSLVSKTNTMMVMG